MKITVIVPFNAEIRNELMNLGFDLVEGMFDGPESGRFPILAVPTDRGNLPTIQNIVMDWDEEQEDLLVISRQDDSVYLIPIDSPHLGEYQGKWVRKGMFSRATQEVHFPEANITYVVEK